MKPLKEYLISALSRNNETWDDVVACTLSDAELNQMHHWGSELPYFTMWTANSVYAVFDDAENGNFIGSLDRNPPAEKN